MPPRVHALALESATVETSARGCLTNSGAPLTNLMTSLNKTSILTRSHSQCVARTLTNAHALSGKHGILYFPAPDTDCIILFRSRLYSKSSDAAQYRTVVTCLPPSRVVVVLDGSCDDRVIMPVADSVQLNFLVISCECVPGMTAGVDREPAAFAVLVQPRVVGSSEPVHVVVCTAVISGSVSKRSRSSCECVYTYMSESLSWRALNCSVTLL